MHGYFKILVIVYCFCHLLSIDGIVLYQSALIQHPSDVCLHAASLTLAPRTSRGGKTSLLAGTRLSKFDWGLDRVQYLALLPWLGCTKLRDPFIGQYQFDGTIICTSFTVKRSFLPFGTRTLTTTPAYVDPRSLKQNFNWIHRPWNPLKWCIIYESSPLSCIHVI